MEYLADRIGEQFKEWTPVKDDKSLGDTIFISSPTGSGKTHFILKVLLPYALSNGKKILYLVNRTVLKEQLEKEIRGCSYALQDSIEVELYQKIEGKILKLEEELCCSEFEAGYFQALRDYNIANELNIRMPVCKKEYHVNFHKVMEYYKKFDYVICDEAHYFLMDSNYNTNTIISYRFVKELFSRKIRIYMSATIDQLKEYVKKENEDCNYARAEWFGFSSEHRMIRKKGLYQEYEYGAERDYSYVDICILRKRNEIAEIVTEGNEKWLIFVDSKHFGEKLKKEICKKLSEKESDDDQETYREDKVVFITSDYESDMDGINEVNEITRNSRQSVKILIATSVLDNGINLKDIELRNIIIIADNEIEFIQMLGRKRFDNKRLKIYIYRLTKEHFIRRQREIQNRQKIVKPYYKRAHELLQPILDKEKVHTNIYLRQINQMEVEYIKSQHKLFLQKIMDNKIMFDDVKTLFMSFDGILYLNRLSLHNMDCLNQFYSRMISEFERYGEDAFLREQLRWLCKLDDEVDEIIRNANRSEFEKCRQKVIDTLEDYVGQKINKKQALDIKNNMVDELHVIMKNIDDDNPDKEKYVNSLRKNDRPISIKMMDFLRENAEIPYILQSEGKSNYILKRCEKV